MKFHIWPIKLEMTFKKHQESVEMKENVHSPILQVEVQIVVTFLEMT